MATVEKATQTSLDCAAAIRGLRHDADPQFMAASSVRPTCATAGHHNFPIHDYNDQNGLLYLVLQYVEDGRTLAGTSG